MNARKKNCQRRGTILTEFVVCCVLLAGVSATLVPLVNHVHRVNQNARFESLALLEISNLHQRVLAGTSLDDLEASDWMKGRFPDAQVNAIVDENDATRFQITISRPISGYEKRQEISITFWNDEVPQ